MFCYCQFLFSWLLAFALYICGAGSVWCICIYNCCIFSWIDHLIIMWCPPLSLATVLILKFICLIWDLLLFLLISIFLFPGRNGMEYLFLSPHFHSVCVPRFKVGPLKTEHIRILFLYPFSLSVSFGWSIYSILHLS